MATTIITYTTLVLTSFGDINRTNTAIDAINRNIRSVITRFSMQNLRAAVERV